jgi:hypothetical protein
VTKRPEGTRDDTGKERVRRRVRPGPLQRRATREGMQLALWQARGAFVPQETYMRHADRPTGPGKPLRERRDAVDEQEEIDEMETDAAPDATPPGDPGENARHADRNSHTDTAKDGAGDNASGGS